MIIVFMLVRLSVMRIHIVMKGLKKDKKYSRFSMLFLER